MLQGLGGLFTHGWPCLCALARDSILANISGKWGIWVIIQGASSGDKRKYKEKVAGILRRVPEGKENNHEEESHL